MLVPRHTQVGDVLVILFGLPSLIVLHSGAQQQYQVAGLCFAYGLTRGEALVGPVPQQWRFVRRHSTKDQYAVAFQNKQTGEVTTLDPRINWEELEVDESDPRLDPELSEKGQGPYRRPDEEYLLARGVKVETFQLV